jgi:hypothetical protein
MDPLIIYIEHHFLSLTMIVASLRLGADLKLGHYQIIPDMHFFFLAKPQSPKGFYLTGSDL